MTCPNCGGRIFRLTQDRCWYLCFNGANTIQGGTVPRTCLVCDVCEARPQGENLVKLQHVAAQALSTAEAA